jgi:hypothetical protein
MTKPGMRAEGMQSGTGAWLPAKFTWHPDNGRTRFRPHPFFVHASRSTDDAQRAVAEGAEMICMTMHSRPLSQARDHMHPFGR